MIFEQYRYEIEIILECVKIVYKKMRYCIQQWKSRRVVSRVVKRSEDITEGTPHYGPGFRWQSKNNFFVGWRSGTDGTNRKRSCFNILFGDVHITDFSLVCKNALTVLHPFSPRQLFQTLDDSNQGYVQFTFRRQGVRRTYSSDRSYTRKVSLSFFTLFGTDWKVNVKET